MRNLKHTNLVLFTIVLTAFVPQNVFAYVGPGTGLSAIGAFLALIVGSFVAIMGFFWYPIKRLLGKKKNKEPDQVKNEDK